MNKYWRIVWDMIEDADVVLEVVDARFPSICRSNRLEQKVAEMKHCNLLIALNKSDLVPREYVRNWINWLEEHENIKAVEISAIKRLGTSKIRKDILRLSRRKTAKVAVVGLPNTGKSSIINALSGRRAASVAPISGHTKGKQTVNISKSIIMFDTPGIIPVLLPEKHRILLGVIPITKIKEPIDAAYSLFSQFEKIGPGKIFEHYNLNPSSEEPILTQLARKHNKLRKGGLPDERAAAVVFLTDHFKGQIPIFEDINNPLRFK